MALIPINRSLFQSLHRILQWLTIGLTTISILMLVYDIGFKQPDYHILTTIYQWYIVTFSISILSFSFQYSNKNYRPPRKLWIFDGMILGSLIFIWLIFTIPGEFESLAMSAETIWVWVFITLILTLFRELFSSNINEAFHDFNPAQLFVASFLILIVLGTLALKLPNATHAPISILDAFFTATSAVCVTGLIVLDTGKDFTHFGQIIIMVLIQLGGLGIMTFTSFFSYFFHGDTSYKSQLLIREITNSRRLTEAYSMIMTILIFTLGFEVAGGLLIYISLPETSMMDASGKIFFSVFHSISAFCNAGFSTFSNNLYQPEFRTNYPLQLIIGWLFIFGGLGFPIVFNFIKYLRYHLVNTYFSMREKTPFIHQPWLININTRIVLFTTAILLVVGTLTFFIFESNYSLSEHSLWGKIVVSFFNGATPRTAGFNTVDFSQIRFHTVMVVIALMWIGASPMSTGGGIKTTTYALSLLNISNLVRGRSRIELMRRQISGASVQRAFAVMYLSVIVIGISIFFISAFDPHVPLIDVVFESFSAYSTVGLSMGITSGLSDGSKIVLILTMFTGRVTMFTILVAIFRRVQFLNYKYPTEEILIN